MRKFAKIMAVLLALGFVASCGAKKKAVTKWGLSNNDGAIYLTFCDDGTVEMSTTVILPYTGDTKKNGTITLNGATYEIKGDQLFGEGMVFTKMKE